MSFLKGVVLALVLANIGYFLWVRNVSDSSLPPAPAAAPSIKLASELPRAAHSEPPVPATPPGTAQEVAAPPAVDAASPAATTGSGVADDGAGAVAGDAPVLLTNVQRCVSVGPFRDVAEATRAATSLRARGYGPRQRVADGEVWAGVWVYLPRPDDALAADQLLTRLKKAGVDDALEMPGPGDATVISLGLFSEGKRAQSRVEQVKGLGLKPLVVDRKRTGNVFWVDVDLRPTDTLLNPADLQGEAGRDAGNRIVRLEVKGCPG
jgi:hypothetical protein